MVGRKPALGRPEKMLKLRVSKARFCKLLILYGFQVEPESACFRNDPQNNSATLTFDVSDGGFFRTSLFLYAGDLVRFVVLNDKTDEVVLDTRVFPAVLYKAGLIR
jgi:hypothetical protein